MIPPLHTEPRRLPQVYDGFINLMLNAAGAGKCLGLGWGWEGVVFGALLGEEVKKLFFDPIFFPDGPNEARLGHLVFPVG
jgi:hypothetical protein